MLISLVFYASTSAANIDIKTFGSMHSFAAMVTSDFAEYFTHKTSKMMKYGAFF